MYIYFRKKNCSYVKKKYFKFCLKVKRNIKVKGIEREGGREGKKFCICVI